MRNTAKVLLVLGFLALGAGEYVQRLSQLTATSVIGTVFYLGLFAVLAGSLFAAAFIRPAAVRWPMAIVFMAAAVFWKTSVRVTGGFLTYDEFISQIDASVYASEALQQYWMTLAAACATSLPVLLGVGLRPAVPRSSAEPDAGHTTGWQPILIAAPLAALVVLTAVLFVRGGDGGRGLPAMFTPLAYVNLFAYEHLTQSLGPREPVRLPRANTAVPYDIVLIVDESVSGNYLDTATPTGVPTPLSAPPPVVDLYNFGYAASITNCSAGVNVTLRFGGTRDDYVRINARMPSIWQYARTAGLETVFIDAQRTNGQLINGMDAVELEHIDRWIQFDEVAVRDRDMAVAATLSDLFADGDSQFVYVNKMGAHFPVHDKAPAAFVQYRPTLARGLFRDVADTGSRLGFGGTAADWALYRNSYRNTLLWSVGEFFRRIFAAGHLDRAVIIYTSDHGQDLHERGNPGLNTHCGNEPVMEEGLVPLVVLQGAGQQTLDWGANLAENRNHSSHYNIFPTLLQLMGYRLDAVRETYGNPLTVPTNDPFTFNTRFNARLGAPPRWEFIDLNQIVIPSANADTVASR